MLQRIDTLLDCLATGDFSSLSSASGGPSKLSKKRYLQLKEDLKNLVLAEKCAPILVRLAWHDAGTYDKKSNTGGPRAAMRFTRGESGHAANNGLQVARNLIGPIVDEYSNEVPVSDIWALGAVVAIEVSGGPKIPFRFGRVDARKPNDSVEEGRLPDATQGLSHLRDVFNRMGFNDRDIVALSGAHTLGSCHYDRSGFNGPWTDQPLVFDNSYFKDLAQQQWDKKTLENGNVQYNRAKGGATMMLISDLCLFQENDTKNIVQEYAQNQDVFFRDFAVAFQKLIESGYKESSLFSLD